MLLIANQPWCDMSNRLAFLSSRLKRVLKRRAGMYSPEISEMRAPCLHCGARHAIPITLPVIPDFDATQLPLDIQSILVSEKANGTCVCCGLSQAYGRPTASQLSVVNTLGKDATTSEQTYISEAARKEGIARFRSLYVEPRLERWTQYFAGRTFSPKRALFIRHWFGDTMQFIRDHFEGCEVFGVDMSAVCREHVAATFPNANLLDGEINGHLCGPFTNSGPYDAIFTWHVLTHAVDPHAMLRTIDSMLAPDGIIVMSHEVGPKPTNPFHMLHLGEMQVKMLAAEHFDHFEIISDCNPNAAQFVRRGSPRFDEADYVVHKRA